MHITGHWLSPHQPHRPSVTARPSTMTLSDVLKFRLARTVRSQHCMQSFGDIVVPMSESLMILVAGPYRSGTGDDPTLIQANVKAMTDAALKLFRMGHLPAMGEWFALPLVEHAGSRQIGDDVFNEI